MPYKLVAPIVALAIVSASPAPAHAVPRRARAVPPTAQLDAFGIASVGLHRLGAYLLAVEAYRKRLWIEAYADAQARARAEDAQARARTVTTSSAPATSSGACGAVPAYISYRESRCTYTARNPSGAGGAYQLMPGTADAMAQQIGHPELVGVNASEWPPDLQDEAAAALWDGGAGACNWTPPNYCA